MIAGALASVRACATTSAAPKAKRSSCVARAAENSSEQNPAAAMQQEAFAKVMQNPEARRMVEEQMKSPAVQAQMAQMASAMANPQLQERLAALKDDPEFADMFEAIRTGGMPALMRYWDDPVTLKKLGAKLGNVGLGAAGAAAAAAVPPSAAAAGPGIAPVAPEINTLFDAAKFGDLEAVEDFVAVGKDVNMQDPEARTPLHYATAHDHAHVVSYLLKEGADKELADAKGNTPLHYAAGYGRVDIVEILLDAGSDTAAKNDNGKTPADIARLNAQNPVLSIPEIVERLDKVAA